MQAIILNTNFEQVALIDVYESFIWTDRYQETGDFELYMPIELAPIEHLQKDYYLWIATSDHAMIIESIAIESDVEDGSKVVVKGHSLESLLQRRVVWNRTVIADGEKLQNGIKTLITENIITPADTTRTISNFIFEESDDEAITSIVIDEELEYFGEDLYTVIRSHCVEHEIGFKISLNLQNQFVFKLYAGVDRTYEQEVNPYVVFSPKYGNLLNSNYIESVESWKNVAIVAGDEEGSGDNKTRANRVVMLNKGSVIGITRREIYINVSGIKKDSENCMAHLKQKGIDALMENCRISAFEGEQDLTNRMYMYGEDYFMGDIVQVENEFGQEGRAYVSEFIISCDESGTTMYPTFKSILKGEYEA